MTALSTGLKVAVVTGGAGLVGSVAYALVNKKKGGGRSRAPAASSALVDAPIVHLERHDALYERCLELSGLRHAAPESYRALCVGLEALLSIASEASSSSAETVKGAWPGMARHAAAAVTEALRALQDANRMMSSSEFEEAAGAIQTLVENLQHNIIHDVSVRMAG